MIQQNQNKSAKNSFANATPNTVAIQTNNNVKVVEVNGKKGKIEIVKTQRSGIVCIQQND